MQDSLVSTRLVLVVVPDRELRASIEFALEAERLAFQSHTGLAAALESPERSMAACLVVDENAIATVGCGDRLDRLEVPVVLLVDRLKVLPVWSGIRVLTKPLLGRLLIETVAGTVSAEAAPRSLRSFP